MRTRPGADSFMQNRPVGDAGIDPVAELDPSGLCREGIEKWFVQRVHNEDPVHGDADLPHIGERPTRGGRRRLRRVGVVQHDERALPAEFQR
jgi:hypothetical protein